MTELKAINFNGVDAIDSRQVAKAVGKKHKNLLRDIRTYCGYLTELKNEPVNESKIGLVNETKIGPVDFFIESTYTDTTGRTLPCYLCTKKGCEMIAHKLTSKKGVIFTALYINAFHEMEKMGHQKLITARIFEKLDDMNATT